MTSEDKATCRRHNHVHAAYVEAAIRLSALTNVRQAEDMLRREGIPMNVITRVLLQKGHHRIRSTELNTKAE